MPFKRSKYAIGALLFGAMLAGPQGASAAEFTLRFATINLADTVAYERVLAPFARGVEQDSNQRIEVALKPMGGYGKPAELFNMVERGDIEIASTVQGYNPGRFPQSSVMELPLMFDSAMSGSQAIWKLYKDGQLDRDYASVKVLGLYTSPPFGIFTNGRKINGLRDLRGLRIRTPSPTMGLALARLGAIPVGMPVDLLGDMLESGTIDAITFGWDPLFTAKGAGDKRLTDQVNVLVDAKFAAPSLMIVMNLAAWKALPPDLQAIVEKHSASFILDNARLRDESEVTSRQKLRANPHNTYRELTADERNEMARIIEPAIADWKATMARQGLDGEALYERARATVRQFNTAAR